DVALTVPDRAAVEALGDAERGRLAGAELPAASLPLLAVRILAMHREEPLEALDVHPAPVVCDCDLPSLAIDPHKDLSTHAGVDVLDAVDDVLPDRGLRAAEELRGLEQITCDVRSNLQSFSHASPLLGPSAARASASPSRGTGDELSHVPDEGADRRIVGEEIDHPLHLQVDVAAGRLGVDPEDSLRLMGLDCESGLPEAPRHEALDPATLEGSLPGLDAELVSASRPRSPSQRSPDGRSVFLRPLHAREGEGPSRLHRALHERSIPRLAGIVESHTDPIEVDLLRVLAPGEGLGCQLARPHGDVLGVDPAPSPTELREGERHDVRLPDTLPAGLHDASSRSRVTWIVTVLPARSKSRSMSSPSRAPDRLRAGPYPQEVPSSSTRTVPVRVPSGRMAAKSRPRRYRFTAPGRPTTSEPVRLRRTRIRSLPSGSQSQPSTCRRRGVLRLRRRSTSSGSGSTPRRVHSPPRRSFRYGL